MYLVILSTSEGKYVYSANFGREWKELWLSIVKTCILNERIDLFGMFSLPAAAEAVK